MIEFAFIGSLEGRSLNGYVPDVAAGRSGVTIATGCDLGWATPAEFVQFPDLMQIWFRPYLGLRGSDAAAFLKAHPLSICAADADAIDAVTFADDIATISNAWNRDAVTVWATVPARAQTVIASVGFQYGNLKRKTPHFWAHSIARNWDAMHADLENFGDAFETRRHKEANYLAPLLTA
ncbi:MAG TPA: pesticin C-terminus-like muramidase [Rhizomicrobium sp.]|jgi:hypothetical protein|nr:pesticin C-terminus-like muramidase [Rhizomicrobium sp.]